MKFIIKCKKCKSTNIEILLDNDGGCNDPDCCGGRHYFGVQLTCKTCKETENIECEDN